MRGNAAVSGPRLEFYVPLAVPFGLRDVPVSALYVRPAADPERVVPIVSREMRTVAPDLPYPTVQTLEDILGPSLRPWRMGVAMFLLSGLLALAVAALGLYGVLTYTVAQRAHELGIRVALGAAARDVRRLVVGQAVRLTAFGIVLGVAGACAMGRILSSLLYQVSPLDLRVFGVVAVMLLAVAALASYLPARRATRVDPMVALRAE